VYVLTRLRLCDYVIFLFRDWLLSNATSSPPVIGISFLVVCCIFHIHLLL